jgi:uncharacterized protein YkwD
MVDKKGIIVILLSIILLTGCGYKRDYNVNTSEISNIAYINEGNTTTTTTSLTTTTTNTTTKKTVTTTKKVNSLYDRSSNNLKVYKNMINEMISYINQYRASEGLSELKYDYHLSLAASIRAQEMSDTGVFEHMRPNGDKWSTIYKELNIKYSRCAENLAYGFNDISKSMKAFMNSETHRRNIMNPDLKYVGIGIAPVGNTYYFVQEFKG